MSGFVGGARTWTVCLAVIGAALLATEAGDALAQSCGALPGTYPISAGSRMSIGRNVRMNNHRVARGNHGPDAVLATNGNVSTHVSQTLPGLVPSSFPSNSSTTDATHTSSPFVATTDVYYRDITIGNFRSASFSGGGPFHIDTLDVGYRGTVNLAAGTYYIDNLNLADRATINVTSEPVILYIGNRVTTGTRVNINNGGNVDGLRVMLYDGARFDGGERLDFTGVIYGPSNARITIGDRSTLRGAFITDNRVTIGDRTRMTYTGADQIAVSAISTCPASTLDHFAVSHDGSAVNCQSEAITISAHLAHPSGSPSVDTSYAGTVTLSTSTAHGDWSVLSGFPVSGTLTNSGNGSATYTFAAGDNGVVTLGLKDTFVESVTIGVADGGIGVDPAEDPPLAYAQSGFSFLAGGVADAIGTQIAGKGSDVAPGAQVIEVQAIDTNTTTGACEAALAGTVNVSLASECIDPAACAGQQVSVGATPIAANDSGSVASYTSVALDFGSALDTTATIAITYPDAGSLKLHARYEIPLGSGAGSGNFMVGASNMFVVRPFGFDIDFSGDRAANGTAGVSYAADETGSRFVKAGESFPTAVRAVVWSAADDADANGVPDAGANLTDNAATPNFGQEATPATATVSQTLVAPAGGAAGVLNGGAAVGGFAAGAATANLDWSEVGIIDLDAASASYLGSGAGVTGTVTNVGRFYPARFAVADAGFALRDGPSSAWTCSFTYMEQPFAYLTDPTITVTAENLGGAPTTNYGGAFWKLTGPWLAARSYTSTAATTAVLDAPAIGTVALTGDAVLDGVGTLTISNETFGYLRAATPVAPFAAQITLTVPGSDLTDSDGVCYDSANPSCNTNDGDTAVAYSVAGIGGASLRFGRLALTNAAGSELLDLTLPMQAQYFDGAGFTLNADDSCSSIGTGSIDLKNDVADPALGTPTIAIGAATTTATIANDPLASGDAGLVLSAPGAGNTGYADLTFDLSAGPGGAAEPWLRYDWDGNGTHDNDPSARGTFGVYSGSPFLIQMREPWN